MMSPGRVGHIHSQAATQRPQSTTQTLCPCLALLTSPLQMCVMRLSIGEKGLVLLIENDKWYQLSIQHDGRSRAGCQSAARTGGQASSLFHSRRHPLLPIMSSGEDVLLQHRALPLFLLIHLIVGAVQMEAHVLSQCQELSRLRIVAIQIEVLFRSELDAH